MARRPRGVAYPVQLRDAISKLAQSARLTETLSAHGNARWTLDKLLAAGVLMSWHEGQTLTSRFEHVRELLASIFPGWTVPSSYTGYATALAREIAPLIAQLKPQLRNRVRRAAGSRWHTAGWIVFAADGSRFESPRTEANEAGLGCAGKQRTAPQVFHTTLLHLGTNAVWDFRSGPGTDSERRHLEEMAADLPPGSLVTADAGFIGYDLCQRLTAQGVSFLLRVGGNITLLARKWQQRIRQTGELVWLWPQDKSHAAPCVLRLLRDRHGRKERFLVTNVLDASRLSHEQAREIYRRRWGIEVTYRSVKQTLDRSRWLSRTPATVLAEHQSTLLGFWLLQVLSLEALARQQEDPCHWSPARARDATRRVLRHALNPATERCPRWSDQLALAVQDHYVRRRPKRARDWPHKKREPPPRPPRLKTLTPEQQRRGLQLLKSS